MGASRQAHTGKRSVGAIVGGLIAFALGSAFAWFGSREAVNELMLRSNHRTVDAHVADARVMQSRKTGRSYEVLYRFNVPGSSQAYTRRDETGRTDLWSSLADEDTWRDAQRTRRRSVRPRDSATGGDRCQRGDARATGASVPAGHGSFFNA